jgi:hypothetical protein
MFASIVFVSAISAQSFYAGTHYNSNTCTPSNAYAAFGITTSDVAGSSCNSVTCAEVHKLITTESCNIPDLDAYFGTQMSGQSVYGERVFSDAACSKLTRAAFYVTDKCLNTGVGIKISIALDKQSVSFQRFSNTPNTDCSGPATETKVYTTANLTCQAFSPTQWVKFTWTGSLTDPFPSGEGSFATKPKPTSDAVAAMLKPNSDTAVAMFGFVHLFSMLMFLSLLSLD